MELTLHFNVHKPTHVHTVHVHSHWFRVVRDTHTHIFTFMSLTVSDSHIPSLHHCSIVIPLCEGRGIRSCVTELLSDIIAVQMDDASTLAWPTDKKSSLFVHHSPLLLLFLPYLSLKAQLQSFVTPWEGKKKRKFFPGFPAGPHPTDLFGTCRRNRKPCGVVTSAVSHRCVISLCSIDNRFLPQAHRTGENQSYVPVVYLCVEKTHRYRCNHIIILLFILLLKMWIFLLTYLSYHVSVPNIRARWFAHTRLRHAVTLMHTHTVHFSGSCPREGEITELYDIAQNSLSSSQLIFPINICLCAEEQAAVRLMIRITAACRPATPAACWEPNSLRGLRSVTHAPPHTPPPSPTCLSRRRSIRGTLSSNDRCLAPPSFSFSSVTLLSCSWTPSSFRHFF